MLTPEDEKLIWESKARSPLVAKYHGAEVADGLADMLMVAEAFLRNGQLDPEAVGGTLGPTEPIRWPPPFPEWDEIKLRNLPRPSEDEKIAEIHRRLEGFDKRMADAEARGDQAEVRALQHTIEKHLRELQRLREAKETH